MRLNSCRNFHDYRALAKSRLPGPIFNYIDGAADDETTHRNNTQAYENVDLIPNVLRGVSEVDLSVTVMGQELDVPFYCSPTALQRLFHHQGESAVAAVSEEFGTMFGVSSLGTSSMEALRERHKNPQIYQFYFHKDRGLNSAMMQRAKDTGVDVIMLTVDSITGGNRERDLRTGFSIPMRLNLKGVSQFISKPAWGINYVCREKYRLPQLEGHVDMSNGATSIGQYFTDMLDPEMNWNDVEKMVQEWGGQFCLKGIMSVEDAKRAVEIGCTGIVLSNHGGRQLDGSTTAFDQLEDVVAAVGDQIDVLVDGGIQRGTHILKALACGAKAVGVGRYYLYPLAAGGQLGVRHAMGTLRAEIVRNMRLMGCKRISDLDPSMLSKCR